MERYPVVIIGSGPSGLLLARLLSQAGIPSLVLEKHTRDYVEGRIRAGLLEQGTIDVIEAAGVAERLHREALLHEGIVLALGDATYRIDLTTLSGGKRVYVYGQSELQKDLYQAVLVDDRITVRFEAEVIAIEGFLDRDLATVTWRDPNGEAHRVQGEFVAGCDGYHGAARRSIPPERLTLFERTYPFGWLGLLADVPPVNDELIYINHPRGFALCSMRSHTRSRYYLQVSLADRVEDWSDERFWEELERRLPAAYRNRLTTGSSLEKSIAPLRSFVAEPLRHGRLFLVGDAGHIVPPTGAKGLNLAASDVHYLAEGLLAHFQRHDDTLLEAYSPRALKRIWGAVRFSWWMTNLLHRFGHDPMADRIHASELEYVTSSHAGQTVIAEQYVGPPF